MENKAKDMCPRCKYCLGMTPQGTYSCGKVNDGSELNIGIDVVLNCANFEWKDGKVEGKASDICPKCKNCKGIIQEYNGKTASIRLTEVECEDPYDGMVKTLDADSDIRCSMFEPRLNEPCDKISLLQHELEMDKLRKKIHELEKEKAAHMKGIERLKKRAADSDYYKEKSELLEERNNNQFNTIREKDKKIGELKSSRDAWSNTATARAEQVIEVTKDRDKWRKLYDSLSETCADYDKRCKEECEKKYRDEISKLQNIVTEKHVEIKGLKKEIINLTFDRATVKDIMKKNIKFKETISDQEITIKALLITIKEMCKDE